MKPNDSKDSTEDNPLSFAAHPVPRSEPGDCQAYAARLVQSLSNRQREVYYWICEGKRDREIAQILGISYRTVSVHVCAILRKLGVENRTSAAMMAARLAKSSPEFKTNHEIR